MSASQESSPWGRSSDPCYLHGVGPGGPESRRPSRDGGTPGRGPQAWAAGPADTRQRTDGSGGPQRGEGEGWTRKGGSRETLGKQLCSECPASAAWGHFPANETHSIRETRRLPTTGRVRAPRLQDPRPGRQPRASRMGRGAGERWGEAVHGGVDVDSAWPCLAHPWGDIQQSPGGSPRTSSSHPDLRERWGGGKSCSHGNHFLV